MQNDDERSFEERLRSIRERRDAIVEWRRDATVALRDHELSAIDDLRQEIIGIVNDSSREVAEDGDDAEGTLQRRVNRSLEECRLLDQTERDVIGECNTMMNELSDEEATLVRRGANTAGSGERMDDPIVIDSEGSTQQSSPLSDARDVSTPSSLRHRAGSSGSQVQSPVSRNGTHKSDPDYEPSESSSDPERRHSASSGGPPISRRTRAAQSTGRPRTDIRSGP